MADSVLIDIQNIVFSRGNRRIFDNISLSIPRGKVTAIMGPSGIGKTTLLRLIAGQALPEAGNIWFDGDNIPTLNRKSLYLARQKMGMLFQSGALFTDMTVFDNVAYPLREHTKLNEAMIKTAVLLKLEAVGLRGAAKLMPSELSGGMARRVALARAIALDPELILFDEPFVGQDPITMGILVELIRNLNQALGLTSVVVSHDVPEVMSIADQVYILIGGKIVGGGAPDEIRRSNNPVIQQFLSGSPRGPISFNYPAESLANSILG